MTSWSEFARAAPDIAELGSALLRRSTIAYLGTIRRDGGPRVHPITPAILGGRLCAGLNRASPKRLDLDRDGRYMLHAFADRSGAEFAVAGRARRLTRDEVDDIVTAAGVDASRPAVTILYELRIQWAMSVVHSGDGGSLPSQLKRRWVEGGRR